MLRIFEAPNVNAKPTPWCKTEAFGRGNGQNKRRKLKQRLQQHNPVPAVIVIASLHSA